MVGFEKRPWLSNSNYTNLAIYIPQFCKKNWAVFHEMYKMQISIDRSKGRVSFVLIIWRRALWTKLYGLWSSNRVGLGNIPPYIWGNIFNHKAVKHFIFSYVRIPISLQVYRIVPPLFNVYIVTQCTQESIGTPLYIVNNA